MSNKSEQKSIEKNNWLYILFIDKPERKWTANTKRGFGLGGSAPLLYCIQKWNIDLLYEINVKDFISYDHEFSEDVIDTMTLDIYAIDDVE